MKVSIVSPGGELQEGKTRTGNRSTASQWGRLIEDQGHEVTILNQYEPHPCDVLIALHGEKLHPDIVKYQADNPEGKLIVGLAGTDIYPTPGTETLDSMERADGIIALQSLAVNQVPESMRDKCAVVLQSAIPCPDAPARATDVFNICIPGHLREVKDPLLLAKASRRLPSTSRIRILQAGDVLDSRYHDEIRAELAENPRYTYLGQLDRSSTACLIASSHMLCLTSSNEGGARVIGEAIVNQTPVLSTRMDGSVGMLGTDYHGYFPVGDVTALTDLMLKCENEPEFLNTLIETTTRLANNYTPEKEREALAAILARVCESR